MATVGRTSLTVPAQADGAERTPHVPKYWALKRELLEMTEALAPGSPMPAERTLALEYDTSRTTVRQALQDLALEGRLQRFHGKGTFVAKPKVAQVLRLTSYTEDMQAQNLVPTSRLLDLATVNADSIVADRLRVPVGAKVLRIERLRMADGEPMAIERTSLSAKRFPGLRRHFTRHGSLYAALAAEYGVHLAEAEETIETGLPSPEEAAVMDVDVRMPLLLLSRHSFSADGEPVEWASSLYRGDRYKFVARLTRPHS